MIEAFVVGLSRLICCVLALLVMNAVLTGVFGDPRQAAIWTVLLILFGGFIYAAFFDKKGSKP